jgi:hypothetical protein
LYAAKVNEQRAVQTGRARSKGEGSAGAGERAGRPGTVTAAAVLTGIVAALLLGYGIYLVIAGLSEQPVLRGRAEVAGVMFAIFGLGVGLVTRGLLRVEPWARTPALLTYLLAIGACYWQVQGGYYGQAAVAGLFGIGGIVLLFVPASHKVLSRDVR